MNKVLKLLKKALKNIEKEAGVESAFNKINYEYYPFGSFPTLHIGIQIRKKPVRAKLKKFKKSK